ncbi:hypothetical protein A8277_25320 [Salmonella enterica subsp. enterica serovar Typhimurium]|nr:hypothetical protein A8277_25320 [Salmonella enterica subsp. enterica serovar Typhimurium]
MIYIGGGGAQKKDTTNFQGNAQTVVITSAFSDKFLVCFIKVKISCQLKLIRCTGESAIAFSLLNGQKVNGHIGLPA